MLPSPTMAGALPSTGHHEIPDPGQEGTPEPGKADSSHFTVRETEARERARVLSPTQAAYLTFRPDSFVILPYKLVF